MNQPMQLPASIASRARRGTLTSMTQGLGVSSPPRISTKAQRFTLVDSAGQEMPVNLFDAAIGVYLDLVIIGANQHPSKQWYEFEYSPDRDDAPACWSDNGIGASAQAAQPQSERCDVCPKNQWGSAISKMTQKPTKACSDRKKLAALVVGDPASLAYQFVIPPASLKNLRAYADTLRQHQVTDAQGQRPADPADVITRVYFNPAKQGELLFQGVSFVDDALVALTEKADASGVIDVLIGANDYPVQGQLPAPAPVQQIETRAQYEAAAPAPQPSPTFTAAAQPAPAFGAPQAQTNGGGAPPPPAPRSRRGGARAGAGRPAQEQAPAQAPSVAPFAQPAAAPMAPTASAPFPSHSGASPQQGIPTPSPSGGAPNVSPSNAPVPFRPVAASPAAPGVQDGIPDFLRRTAPAPQAPAPQAPAPTGAPAFGMQSAPQPSPELTAAINQAFTTPLTPRSR